MLQELSFSTRRECLEQFAKSMGCNPPRDPIPEWWEMFEKWYVEARAQARLRKEEEPGVTCMTVRLEPFGYEDEGEDEDDDEDDGEGPLDDDEDDL
jgi:hypothetical protein